MKTVKVRAFWTVYGPRFHVGGKNTDCVGDHASWTIAAYDLARWIERNHPGSTPTFYGPYADSAEKSWTEYSKD